MAKKLLFEIVTEQSPSTPHMLLLSTTLLSSVQPSHQMKSVLKNSTLKRCGNPQTELSVTFSMESSSVSQLFARTFLSSSQAGKSQFALAVTLSVINTEPLTTSPHVPANSRLSSLLMMASPQQKQWKFTTSEVCPFITFED